jgi:hypothetical protein
MGRKPLILPGTPGMTVPAKVHAHEEMHKGRIW